MSIGGIYLGVFTPVEAAGVGATLVSILALGSGSVKFSAVPNILLETVTMTAMLYLIIIGAHVFGPFLALTHIPETLAQQLPGESLAETWKATEEFDSSAGSAAILALAARLAIPLEEP